MGLGGEVMICLDAPSHKKDVCEALLRRAQLNSHQQLAIEEMLKLQQIGSEGEYKLKLFFLDLALGEPHLLFFNYEALKFERFTYQMDAIFICERFILLLENKHIAGDIYYDEVTHQFWREYNGERLALTDPFAQVMRHEDWMLEFLMDIQISMPVISAVILTTNSSFLHNMPKQFSIYKLPGLRIKLQQLLQTHPKIITANTLKTIHEKLMERYKPKKWEHPYKHIIINNGALCHCGLDMTYKRGKFQCRCGYMSKEPLLQGLHDYRLLVNDWITNSEFRAFFHIASEDSANKLLMRLNLQAIGEKRGRKYLIPENIWTNKQHYL